MTTTTNLTVRQAAEATGLSKQGILKAINTGRLSATRGANHEWLIEPVELARVFTIHSTNRDNQDTDDEPEVSSSVQQELESLREKVTLLERIIAEKDEVIRAKDMVIELTTAENTRLATVVAQIAPPKAQRGWWSRLLGGGE
jgi:hypothetical protein